MASGGFQLSFSRRSFVEGPETLLWVGFGSTVSRLGNVRWLISPRSPFFALCKMFHFVFLALSGGAKWHRLDNQFLMAQVPAFWVFRVLQR